MKRMMIVDDSAVMRKNLRSILTQAGYDIVAEAANGEEAYQNYARTLPDLVTMDVTMPIMNGLEAVKKIKAAYPNACIIVISAFDQRSMLFEALEQGAKHYIIKPITAEKLLNVIDKVLQEQGAEFMPEAAIAPPVSISNRNGMFVVELNDRLTADGLQPIRSALQGLLLVKPLFIAFDFGQALKVNDLLLSELNEIIISIQKAGGDIQLIIHSAEHKELLLQKFGGIPIKDE